MNIRIEKPIQGGRVNIPASKSVSHRAVIAAALAEGTSIVENVLLCEDLYATKDAVEALGAVVKVEGTRWTITGMSTSSSTCEVHCRESGSTLRFMIPIMLAKGGKNVFHGSGRLVTRPITPYIDICAEQGIQYRYKGALPLQTEGRLRSGCYDLPGDVSSQFVTGLLLALPLLKGDSEIRITGPLESQDYVLLTLQVLQAFGIQIKQVGDDRFLIPGSQRYQARSYVVEGDYSQAAFWVVAGALGTTPMELNGLQEESVQADRRIVDIAGDFGVSVQWADEKLIVHPSQTKGTYVDVSQCPDLGPALSVLGAASEGRTSITGGKRLRIKESDRITSMATELRKLGAEVSEVEDGMSILAKELCQHEELLGWNDHRVVMALAACAGKVDGTVRISGAEAITKSYPNFFEHMRMAGAVVKEDA